MTSTEIGQLIVNWEARRDERGRLRIYPIPPGDGGGTYEIAGINDRYHLKEARYLKSLILQGRQDEAERVAVEYILSYTHQAATWAPNWRLELFFRDSAFNRGHGGAAKIIQHAVGVRMDGGVGPVTRAAIAKAAQDTPEFIRTLRRSREWYERNIVKRNESMKLWAGLVNRWNKVTAAALASG